jgi:SEC-C motif-containing protein
MSDRRQPCPCGKPLTLQQCCGRYLDDFANHPAPDAESLMRSRYCAFVLLDRNYLLATWHPERRPTDLQLDPRTRWLGLEVRSRRQVDATHAEVEFVARCREQSGKATRIHERSRFVMENGRWFYLDGDML